MLERRPSRSIFWSTGQALNPIKIEPIARPDRSVVLDPLERAAKTVDLYGMISLIAHCEGDAIRNGHRAIALRYLWSTHSGCPFLCIKDKLKNKDNPASR